MTFYNTIIVDPGDDTAPGFSKRFFQNLDPAIFYALRLCKKAHDGIELTITHQDNQFPPIVITRKPGKMKVKAEYIEKGKRSYMNLDPYLKGQFTRWSKDR